MKEETIRTGITLPKSKHIKAKDFAKNRFGSNVSALIEAALDAYMGDGEGLPDPTGENCLVELAKQAVPFAARDMEKATVGKNQQMELAAILLAYAGVSDSFIRVAEQTAKYGK